MSYLSINTKLFDNRTLPQVIQSVDEGDFLCCLHDNQIEPVPEAFTDSHTAVKSTEVWYLYPITRKSNTSLYTRNIRWCNLVGSNLLRSSTGGHGVSSILPNALFQEAINQNNQITEIRQDRNRLVLTLTNKWLIPIPMFKTE